MCEFFPYGFGSLIFLPVICTTKQNKTNMSTLGKSIVRGFGFAVGAQVAKNVMSTPVNTNYRIFGISTKRQWYSIGLWVLSFGVIGLMGVNDLIVLFAVVNLVLGLPLQILIQYFLQNNSDQKENQLQFQESLSKYQSAVEMATKQGVNISELIVNNMTSSHNLSKFADLINNKVNRTNQFRVKYQGQELNDIVNRKVWLGMSIENLTDMLGKPTQVEVDQNSRSKYETLIYGESKRKGDVYTFRNGLLKEYKDR